MLFGQKLSCLPSFTNLLCEPGERRKVGQRTLISSSIVATLQEWESFSASIRQQAGASVVHDPLYVESDVPRFTESQMDIHFDDFAATMRSLGHISHGDIVRHLVLTKRPRGRRTRSSGIAVRLVGDFIQDGLTALSDETDHPITIIVGGTLSHAENGEARNRLVLHRASSEVDMRDNVYVEDLELGVRDEVALVQEMTEEMRAANQVLYSGKKRKREKERFMGFRFTQREKTNRSRLHYDVSSASEVLGDLQICIPTVTFIGSANAMDVAEVCTRDKLRSLYPASPNPNTNTN